MENKTIQKTLISYFKDSSEAEKIKLAYRRLKWMNRGENAFYYHGTQESRLESILKEGLKPNRLTGIENYEISDKDAVYLTEDRKEAQDWAEWNRKPIFKAFSAWSLRACKKNDIPLKMTKKEKVFVIIVPKSRIDQKLLQIDKNLCDGTSHEYHGIIEPPFQFYEVSEPKSWY